MQWESVSDIPCVFHYQLSQSIFVLRIENLVARIGFGTEPGKEGREQASDALLCDVFEAKVIVSHQG